MPQPHIHVSALTARGEGQVLDALRRITDAALAFLPEEELLQELLHRVSDILEVDTVAILLLEGDELHARAAKGIEEEVEQGVRMPLGRGFAGRIAAERRAIHIRTSTTPTSSTRSCARRASSPCSASRSSCRAE